ncbi:hypothetical protein [Lacihabitans lacunae]|uniref:Uncharacterized protein n=1 Tax=Lacihabitans lacunae TaxID=1028214 RepID=A0ABV7YTD2_9BACT
MKNLTKTLFLFLSFSQAVFSQIVIKPANTVDEASVTSEEKKMGIGADGNTLNFLPVGLNYTRNVGIGTMFTPTFSVPSSYINDGKLHIRHNSTTSNESSGGPQLILDEYQAGDFARLRFRQSYAVSSNPSYPTAPLLYVRGARFWDVAGFANGANTSEDKLHFQNSGANILTLRGDGNVGILNSNPILPFHINSNTNSTSYNTGAAAIGQLENKHLILDNSRINSFNGNASSNLFLNDLSNGSVVVGTTSNPAGFAVAGYSRLGSTAPNIKMKKLTGLTGPGPGDSVDILHGISSAAKILAIDIHVNYSGYSWVGPNYQYASSTIQFMYTYDNSKITVKNATLPNGADISYKPIVILVTYED